MIVIYSPKDGEGGTYDADELTCSEAEAVCRATDMQWGQVLQDLRVQAPSAMRAVAWAWRKRTEPTLRYSHFDPPLRALKARLTTEEIPDLIDQVSRSPMSAALRRQALAEILVLAVDPEAAQKAIDNAAAPKAQATTPETSESSGVTTNS